MSKFRLTLPVNGYSVGDELTVNDNLDQYIEMYGEKIEVDQAPENKAIQNVPENKAIKNKPGRKPRQ